MLTVVVVEWRYAAPSYTDLHNFIREHYSGHYTLSRFTQDGHKGSVQVLQFDIPARELADILKDKIIHNRPVFAYPTI